MQSQWKAHLFGEGNNRQQKHNSSHAGRPQTWTFAKKKSSEALTFRGVFDAAEIQ